MLGLGPSGFMRSLEERGRPEQRRGMGRGLLVINPRKICSRHDTLKPRKLLWFLKGSMEGTSLWKFWSALLVKSPVEDGERSSRLTERKNESCVSKAAELY